MTTALDHITGALRLIGELAEGETPTSETSADALESLNMMIDGMSTERLAVYSTQDQEFTWPGSTASRTIGPTGDFVGNRPVSLDKTTYFTDGSDNTYPVTQVSEEQYNSISLKTSTSSFPEFIFVNNTMPDTTLTVYPVADDATYWHFISIVELTQPAALGTTITVPPGYQRMFRYNLAVEIAAMFGVEAPPTVKRIAIASKKAVKRLNTSSVDMRMSLPSFLPQGRINSNIFSGT